MPYQQLTDGGDALTDMNSQAKKAVILMAFSLSPVCSKGHKNYNPAIHPGDWYVTDPCPVVVGEDKDLVANVLSFSKYYQKVQGDGASATTKGRLTMAEYAAAKARGDIQRNVKGREVYAPDSMYLRFCNRFVLYLHPEGPDGEINAIGETYPEGLVVDYIAKNTALSAAGMMIAIVGPHCKRIDKMHFISPDIIMTRATRNKDNIVFTGPSWKAITPPTWKHEEHIRALLENAALVDAEVVDDGSGSVSAKPGDTLYPEDATF